MARKKQNKKELRHEYNVQIRIGANGHAICTGPIRFFVSTILFQNVVTTDAKIKCITSSVKNTLNILIEYVDYSVKIRGLEKPGLTKRTFEGRRGICP